MLEVLAMTRPATTMGTQRCQQLPLFKSSGPYLEVAGVSVETGEGPGLGVPCQLPCDEDMGLRGLQILPTNLACPREPLALSYR